MFRKKEIMNDFKSKFQHLI